MTRSIPISRRTILLITVICAIATFCGVQDRLTAEGARRYVRLQQEAVAHGRPSIRMDDVMAPAIERSWKRGLGWGVAVLIVGAAIAALAPPRATFKDGN